MRNATLHVDYGGVRFLIDPMLADRETSPGFARSSNSEFRNPLVSLPMAISDIVNVDAVVVTHLHSDHWDIKAIESIDKSLPVFVQSDADATMVRGQGFTDVRVLAATSEFRGVSLAKTSGQHGTDETLAAIPLGMVSGIVFKRAEEKCLYIAGDTIWNDHVRDAIEMHKPDVIVLNAGKATFDGFPPIIMGEVDVIAVHKAAPEAKLVASHMEAVNHCVLSRKALREFAEREGFSGNLAIPADGETLAL
ncbi:MBL fold metallo-hydrolase [Agrobacterium sp. NPDC090283]|uniref:MBL fold metallo-hydrolase n=1 Tax=Agrobacterium sp. NPDC090283 TaxID=3363920 RepID=UPI00383AAD0F